MTARCFSAQLAVAFAVAGCGAIAIAGCRGQSSAPAPSPAPAAETKTAAAKQAATEPAALKPAKPGRLPEDPIAGKRSTEQWREHLEEEEHERQLGFDRERVVQHRAVVKAITAARARYDRARTEAAVAKARTDVRRRIADVRSKVTRIDHWGVNSPLLPDYEALTASLDGAYADAKIAALRGDPGPLAQASAAFDQRMKKIAEWLKEAAESEPEY